MFNKKLLHNIMQQPAYQYHAQKILQEEKKTQRAIDKTKT